MTEAEAEVVLACNDYIREKLKYYVPEGHMAEGLEKSGLCWLIINTSKDTKKSRVEFAVELE